MTLNVSGFKAYDIRGRVPDELNNEIEQLMTNVNKRKSKGQKALGYITSNTGATEKTMEVIRKYLKRNA